MAIVGGKLTRLEAEIKLDSALNNTLLIWDETDGVTTQRTTVNLGDQLVYPADLVVNVAEQMTINSPFGATYQGILGLSNDRLWASFGIVSPATITFRPVLSQKTVWNGGVVTGFAGMDGLGYDPNPTDPPFDVGHDADNPLHGLWEPQYPPNILDIAQSNLGAGVVAPNGQAWYVSFAPDNGIPELNLGFTFEPQAGFDAAGEMWAKAILGRKVRVNWDKENLGTQVNELFLISPIGRYQPQRISGYPRYDINFRWRIVA